MRIDGTHRGWFVGTIAALAVSAVVYVPYALSSRGPRGGSVTGLVYGSVGFAFMLFAGLLGLRKRFPIWRIGRAQLWMRGHLWLGFLAFPLILFHGGFHFGGTLTRVMMWMFTFVFVSGIAGAVIQHSMPRTHTAELPMETIYEQIDHVRDQLVMEAGKVVEETCEALAGELSRASERQLAVAASAGTNWDMTIADGLNADEHAGEQLRQFFLEEALPFLEKSGGRGFALADSMRGRSLFAQLRLNLLPNLHGAIDSLETLCEEKRQLDRQKQMHLVLHGWLLVHVPLSYAVLLLGAIHAVVALKY
jgi:hypothetical protein